MNAKVQFTGLLPSVSFVKGNVKHVTRSLVLAVVLVTMSLDATLAPQPKTEPRVTELDFL